MTGPRFRRRFDTVSILSRGMGSSGEDAGPDVRYVPSMLARDDGDVEDDRLPGCTLYPDRDVLPLLPKFVSFDASVDDANAARVAKPSAAPAPGVRKRG